MADGKGRFQRAADQAGVAAGQAVLAARAPYSPVAGVKLGATQLNTWAALNRRLWNTIASDWDVFTGVAFSSNSGYWTGNVEQTCWAGYFRYAGVRTLLAGFSGPSFRLYVTDDTSEKLVFVGGGLTGSLSIALATDGVTALNFTVGKTYHVRATIQQNGGTATARIDYLAIVLAQPWAWAAPASFANGYGESAADLAALAQNQKYLLAQLGPVGASAVLNLGIYAGTPNPVFYNGSFWVRNGPLGNQRSLSILYQCAFGIAAQVRVYAAAGALQYTSANLNNDGALHLDVLAISGTLAPNTFARVTVTANGGITVKRITAGGAIALTNNPPQFAYLDTLNGNAGADQLFIVGNQNLVEIKAALGGAVANGFQFLTPGLGQTLDDGTAITSWQGAERIHTGRTLFYTGTGSALYGTKTVALPAAPVGADPWASVDLNAVPDLPYGMSLKITGVSAAYEVP